MEYPGFSIFGQTERQSGANRKKTDPDPIKKGNPGPDLFYTTG